MTPPGWGKTMSEAKQTNLKNIPHPALRDEPYAWQAVGGTIWTSEDDRTLKPQWQGLTDEDVNEITKNVIAFKSDVVKFIREAEAMLREKNT